MDDSSGDERYSRFHLERPLQITVANEQVRRESRSRRRDQSPERPRHGRSRAHAPSVHQGSDVQEGRRRSRDRDLRLSSRSRLGSRLESRVVRASHPEGSSVGHQSRERERCHEGSFSRSQAGSRLESVPSFERTERGRSPCRSHVGSRQRHEGDSGRGYGWSQMRAGMDSLATRRRRERRNRAHPYQRQQEAKEKQASRWWDERWHQETRGLARGPPQISSSQSRGHFHPERTLSLGERRQQRRPVPYEVGGRQMMTIHTQQRVRTRVVRSLEVERIVRMGPETVSAAAAESAEAVVSSSGAENDAPVSEVLSISFSALHGAPRNLPTHAQMVAPPVMGSTATVSLEAPQVVDLPPQTAASAVMNPPTHAQMVALPLMDSTATASREVPQVVDLPTQTAASAVMNSSPHIPPATGPASSVSTRMRSCPICGREVHSVKRHVEMEHFPWYFTPEIACWQCKRATENHCSLMDRHKCCVEWEVGRLTEERFLSWIQTMKELLQEMAILLGFSNELELLDFCRRERLPPAAPGVTLSPTREAYLMWLEQYQKRTVTSIEIQPPNCPSALLNWTTVLGLFQRLSPQQQEWIRHFPVSPAQWQAPGVDVVDAHCHLDMLAQRWHTSPGEALRRCIEQAPEPRMNLLAIVSNCCFPKEWCHAPRVSVELGVRVALTFGVHPRVAVGWEDWNSLQQRVESQECVAVGECGLDYIRPGRQQQRRVFRGQIRLAKSTGKPLVLHLRGRKGGDDEVYMEALGLLLEEGLPRRHPIYLHCYVASWRVYSAWVSCFSNVILGFSTKTTQIADFEKLARSIPFERIGLESDAPHLSPFPGRVNKPLLLHYQAGLIGRARNVPMIVVLAGAAINVLRFFHL